MSKDIDELVDSIANLGKYVIKRAVEAAHDVEGRVKPTEKSPEPGAAPKIPTDFCLGEWRLFAAGGSAYRVVAPIRYLPEKDDWLMRIELKDGSSAEFLLSQIHRSPLLQESDPAS